MRRDLFLGPPGTGKTTRLLREIDGLRQAGFDLHEIGFLSFTRRAIQEARERGAAAFGCTVEDVPWFRTLHSAFSRACKLSNWMEGADYKAFREGHGYNISSEAHTSARDDDAGIPTVIKTEDDRLYEADSYARVRMCSLDEAARRVGVHRDHLETFSARYRRFKYLANKHDHTDILEQAVARCVRLPVTALIVDEAQDLSPLQIAAIMPTIEAARVVIVAGDDDQAIFTFAGSEPDWIISLASSEHWNTEVLSQSYRVPRGPWAMAQRIIGRNQNRVSKAYAPRDHDGLVQAGLDILRVVGTLAEADSGAFLARTRMGTMDVAEALYERRDTPYVVHRGAGHNPLGRPKQVEAVRTAARLARGEPVSRIDLDSMLEYVPSQHELKLLPHGVKASVKRFMPSMVTPFDVVALGLGKLQAFARDHGHVEALTKIEASDRAWFQSIWTRYGNIPEPRIVVSTIHSTKGAEWDTVAIGSDHPYPVEQSLRSPEPMRREPEHRVAYVGVTRAKRRLVIARQAGRFGYPYPC